MRKTKAERGITLVALIITIIVLLILAVVAINAVQNDGIIPKGGSYKKAGTSTPLGEGEKFPTPPVEGDEYVYGDYKYIYYNKYSKISADDDWSGSNDEMNGWKVILLIDGEEKYSSADREDVTSVGEILTTINGADVKSLYETFRWCTALKVSPTIPNTVVDMRGSFMGCSQLSKAPEIPESVENMQYTFNLCYGLETIDSIPSNVRNMYSTFSECYCLSGTIVVKTTSEKVENRYDSCFFNTVGKITLQGTDENLLNNLAGTVDNPFLDEPNIIVQVLEK